jgi:hypothetical protein
MQRLEVDGATPLSWRPRVQAQDERDAREQARHIASWTDLPSRLATVEAAQHRIQRRRLTDPQIPQPGRS